MPRDGSSIYHIPPGTEGIPDTTIESAKYNGFAADIEQDLNLPRPILAGGTGATNAHDAMTTLGGEIASQLVDNYDTFPFVDGSFVSMPGATSAPSAGYIAGIVYGAGITGDICLEAVDFNAPNTPKYMRRKVGNVWGAWTGGNVINAPIVISDPTPSTSPTTGALVVNGGAGISGDLNVGGSIGAAGAGTFAGGVNTTNVNATGTVTAAAILAGGITSAGASSAINWTDRTTSMLWTQYASGGLTYLYNSAHSNLIGVTEAGLTYIYNGTDSADVTTGALVVSGGLGVAKNIYNGGVVHSTGAHYAWAYYDINNVAYYCSPSAISILNGANFGGAVNVAGILTSTAGITSTAQIMAQGNQNTGMLTGTGVLGGIMLQSAGSGAAFMAFWRVAGFATYFGLDVDNQMAVGGWSNSGLGYFKCSGLGVGTPAVGVGYIVATQDVYAFYSDQRLKKDIETIDGALDKIKALRGIYFKQNELAAEFGYDDHSRQVGVIAQEVEEVMPEVVKIAPFDMDGLDGSKSGERYLTVKYEKLVPLLIEAVKELAEQVEDLRY